MNVDGYMSWRRRLKNVYLYYVKDYKSYKGGTAELKPIYLLHNNIMKEDMVRRPSINWGLGS